MNIKERNKRVIETRRQQQAEQERSRETEHDKPHQPKEPKQPTSRFGGGFDDRDRLMVELGWWHGRATADRPNADDVAKAADRIEQIRKIVGPSPLLVVPDYNPRPAVPRVPSASLENATAEITSEVIDGQ